MKIQINLNSLRNFLIYFCIKHLATNLALQILSQTKTETMGNRKNALLALGLAGAAYWLFKMKPEDKEKLKEKVKSLGNQAADKIPDEIKAKLGLKKEDFAK